MAAEHRQNNGSLGQQIRRTDVFALSILECERRQFVADLDGPVHNPGLAKCLSGSAHRGANPLRHSLGTRGTDLRELFLQAHIGLLLEFRLKSTLKVGLFHSLDHTFEALFRHKSFKNTHRHP